MKDYRPIYKGLSDGLFGILQPSLNVFGGLDCTSRKLDELRLRLHQLSGGHKYRVKA